MFFIFLITPTPLIAQNLRCLTAPSYSMIKNGGSLIKINKSISVCFNDYYFSFYTPLSGTRTFRITNNSIDTLESGYVRQRFMNDENETNMKGDYNIEIDYEKKKTVVISFTKFGEAYIVQVPVFAGSVEQNQSKYNPIKKAISERIKEDTTFYPNYVKNPQLKHITAKSDIDIEDYIRQNVKWTSMQQDAGFVGKADFIFTIDTSGYVKNVEPNKGQSAINLSAFPAGSKPDLIFDTVALVLRNMPKWSKPHDKNGNPKIEQCVIHLDLNAK